MTHLIDDPPRDGLLIRAMCDELEPVGLRAEQESDSPGTLFGLLAVFDEWTEINSAYEGHFMERVCFGAFAKTFGEGRQRVLYHHGIDPAVGMRPLGSPTVLEEREDMGGAYYEVPLLAADYCRELAPAARAGLLGSSFRFGIIRKEDVHRPRKSAHNPKGLPERSLIELRVPEFGPTPLPQYAGATAGMRSSMRSMTDDFALERMRGHATALVPADLTPEPAPDRSPRQYRRAAEFIASTPWMIEPEMLATIAAIIGERMNGDTPSDEEIQRRIGLRAQSEARDAPDPVRIINIMGPITPRATLMSSISGGASVETIQGQLRDAMNDPAVEQILLNVDSPGGNAYLIPELAADILEARDIKPITAVANPRAGSAAYFLASQASELVVTDSGEVGSIGVYTMHQDLSGFYEKAGVKPTLISAGKYKTEANPFEPLSEEAAANLQEEVDGLYDVFLNAVSDGRGVDVAVVKDTFGEGRMVNATKAVELGMADSVGTFTQTLERLTGAATAPADSADEAATEDVLPDVLPAAARHPVAARRGAHVNLTAEEEDPWRI